MDLSSNVLFQSIKCWSAAGSVAAAALAEPPDQLKPLGIIKSQDKSSRRVVLTPSQKKKVVGGGGGWHFLVSIFSPVFLHLRGLEMYFKLLMHSQSFSSWFGVWFVLGQEQHEAKPPFPLRSFVTIIFMVLINDGKTTSQTVSTALLPTGDCTGRDNWFVPL